MIGPVQVLVLGFNGTDLSDEVLAALSELGSAGVVRLVDLLLVVRTGDGSLRTAELPDEVRVELSGVAADLLGQPETAVAGTRPRSPERLDVVPRRRCRHRRNRRRRPPRARLGRSAPSRRAAGGRNSWRRAGSLRTTCGCSTTCSANRRPESGQLVVPAGPIDVGEAAEVVVCAGARRRPWRCAGLVHHLRHDSGPPETTTMCAPLCRRTPARRMDRDLDGLGGEIGTQPNTLPADRRASLLVGRPRPQVMTSRPGCSTSRARTSNLR